MAHQHARDAALDYAKNKNRESRVLVERALCEYPPPRLWHQTIELATSNPHPRGFMPLSNFAVRSAAQCALSEALLNHYDRMRTDPSVRHFLATIAIIDGFSLEDAPKLAVARLKRKVRRMLKAYGLQGICVFDIDVLAKKIDDEPSRRLCLHVHAVCWTRDPKFQHKKLGKALSALPEWYNPLSIPGVQFRSRKQSNAAWRAAHDGVNDDWRFRHPERDQTARSMAWLGYYLLKAPLYCKNVIHIEGSRPRMRSDSGAFRLKTALRCAEIWSLFSPGDAMFAVGPEGTAVSTDVAARLRAWSTNSSVRRPRDLSRSQVEHAWNFFYRRYPALGAAVVVLGR